MKYSKRIAALLLAVWLLPVMAHATEGRTGSITVTMEFNGTAVTGGSLTAYRVAKFGQLGLEVLPPYQVGELTPENLNDPALAESFAGQTNGEGIVSSVDGVARFENLELGLYLIVQTESCPGFEPLKPFLISVPMSDGVYDVNAQGKFQLQQEPTDPPGPGLPQTGQLNWPIPVLAAVGLVLFAAGWVLCFGKKNHEK